MLIDVTDLKTIPKKIEDIIMTDFWNMQINPLLFLYDFRDSYKSYFVFKYRRIALWKVILDLSDFFIL